MKLALKCSLILFAGFLVFSLINCSSPQKPEVKVKEAFVSDLKAFKSILADELIPLVERKGSSADIQKAFLKARLAYKKTEILAEYFMPTTVRLLNGPPLDEIETEENAVFEPGGLQVAESLIYTSVDEANMDELKRELQKLLIGCNRMEKLWEEMAFTEAHIFDASKLEIFRIITLSITGFDTPIAKNAVNESIASLESVSNYLSFYNSDAAELNHLVNVAVNYMKANNDFDSFDRMNFIVNYANPLTREIVKQQKEKGLSFIEGSLLKGNAATLFDENIFNADQYAPNAESVSTKQKVQLGKMLFFDNILSKDGRRACVSCHQPDKAFTDGLAKSVSFDGKGVVKRNAPTLINAGFQPAQFYDLRSPNLENQAGDVIANKDEMHGSLDEATVKLSSSASYKKYFKQAFPEMKETVKPRYIQNAIASYIRSLSGLNSRFDQFVRGDKTKMNQEEIAGFNIFMGKGKCGTCHFAPLFNGTVPPAFEKIESEVIGVPEATNAKVSKIDPDLGRYQYHKFDQLKHAFKTTTVRNIALTSPYMHNGVFDTLEEVVDFYDKGGAAGLGIELPNQTLPFDKLSLTDKEKKELVAFMKTLTDTSSANTGIIAPSQLAERKPNNQKTVY